MTGLSASQENRLFAAFASTPPRINPHVAGAAAHLDAWVQEQALVVRAGAVERFARADFAGFAAETYPTVPERELGLVADWLTWLFLLDDQLDDGALGSDTDRVAGLLAAVYAVVAGRPGRPVEGPALVVALADLWARTGTVADDAWRARFVDHAVAGVAAAAWEVENRRQGRIPGEAEYVDRRRHSGAMYVCLDLVEIAAGVALDEGVHGHAAFRHAVESACDVVCWVNDLYSLAKEEALGEWHNLVVVLGHARGLPRASALSTAVDLVVDRLADFESAAAVCPGGPDVAAVVDGMRSWMRGNLDWSARTARYGERPGRDYLDVGLVEAP